MVLKTVLVKSFPELEQLEEAWDRLARAQPRPEIFHTFAWARAWWKAYGHDYEIFSPVVQGSSGEVIAIWPLVRHRSELRALGHGASDNNELLATSETARPALISALDLLAENGKDWNRGCVANISARGLLVGAARSLAGASRTRIEILQGGTGFAAEGDPAQFIQLARKESLRRHRKRLERIGHVTFRHIEDGEEIKRHLSTLERQHIQRWALKGLRSNFLDPASRRHYEGLADYLSPRGWLRFGVLEVDGVPVAYHLGFEFAGKFVWYKPAFDVDFSDYGPGEVLLQSVLHYCAAAGIRELDFTIGEESYKDRFSNLAYDYFQIHLFSHRSARQYGLRIRERLKHNTAFYDRIKSVWVRERDWFRRLGQALDRDGLARFSGKRMRQLFRTLVFRRDEVIVFRLPHEESVRPQVPASECEIVPLRLSLLAEAALRHPDIFSPDRIGQLRKRILAGDRGVVAMRQGSVAHVAWVGKRTSVIAGTETGPNCVLRLQQEVAVIYDCWTPPESRGHGIYPVVLRWLANEELRAGREVWIYCLEENSASRAGILKASFAEEARMVRILWFGRLESCRVTQGQPRQ